MENELFYIFSINTVAYLRSKGLIPVKIERSDRTNKKMFWFKKDLQFDIAIAEYKRNSELQEFIVALKQVKEEIHN